jgi:hypothetical protein
VTDALGPDPTHKPEKKLTCSLAHRVLDASNASLLVASCRCALAALEVLCPDSAAAIWPRTSCSSVSRACTSDRSRSSWEGKGDSNQRGRHNTNQALARDKRFTAKLVSPLPYLSNVHLLQVASGPLRGCGASPLSPGAKGGAGNTLYNPVNPIASPTWTPLLRRLMPPFDIFHNVGPPLFLTERVVSLAKQGESQLLSQDCQVANNRPSPTCRSTRPQCSSACCLKPSN